MSHKKRINRSPYSNKLCHKAVQFVFNTIEYNDPHMTKIVRDSYFINLGILREYARDNHIDEMGYILSIRDELLKSDMAHEYK